MISVIVPVYNTEKYLRKCLDSLANQTYKDYEVIIVNDGSPDNSAKIIDEYTQKYSFMAGYTKENGGLSSARNFGLLKAKGKYVAFVDSDDWVDEDFLECLITKAKEEDFDIVLCDTYMEYQNHQEILKTNQNYSLENIRNYIISYPMACIRLFKKELFKDEYYFTEKILYEDLCLSPTFANVTSKIAFVEKPLYHYLQRDNSIMNQQKFSEKLFDIQTVLTKVYDSFVKNNNFTEYQDEIEYLFITHLLRSTTLRFLDYENGEEKLEIIRNFMISKFPKWTKNKYLKMSSFKLKLITRLAYHKKYKMIKLLKKVNK